MSLKSPFVAALTVAVAIATAPAFAQDAESDLARASNGPQFVPNEVLVKFRPGAAAADKANARGRAGAMGTEVITTPLMKQLGTGDLELLRLPAGMTVANAMGRLKAHFAGRAAAKDALRHHFHEEAGRRFAPADLVIRNDGTGRPVVSGAGQADLPGRPEISISHTDGMAAAAVGTVEDGAHLGVDTERIRPPGQDLLDGAFSDAELALLPRGAGEPDSRRSEWTFRFWCAKEVVGKALGAGVPLDPRQLAVSRADAQSGVVGVRPPGGNEVLAMTFRRGEHVLAVAVSRPTGSP